MQYTFLPGTDLNISCVIFGTWGLAGPPFWLPSNEKEAIELLRSSFDAGINFFDTAPVYGMGHGEILLQKAFAKNRKIKIATKVGLRWNSPDRRSIYHDLSPQSIRWEDEQSLKRLKRDQIDLYQVHWPDPKTLPEDTFSTLEEIKREGKIAHIGVSNFNVEQIMEAQKYATISTVQPRFNYLDQKSSASLLPFCEKNNIGTLIYSPLASGLLTGKYTKEKEFDDWRSGTFADQFSHAKRENTFTVIENLKSKADNLNIPLTQLILEWTLNQKGVSTVISGIRKKDHLANVIEAGNRMIKREDLEI